MISYICPYVAISHGNNTIHSNMDKYINSYDLYIRSIDAYQLNLVNELILIILFNEYK